MKKIVATILMSFILLWGCESDSSDPAEELTTGFSFTVNEGGSQRTFSGPGAVFTSSFTPGVTFEGDDTELNSIIIIAQDPSTGQDLTIGITSENRVSEGSKPIGTDIETFYNAFANYTRTVSGNTVFFESRSGSIRLSNVSSSKVSGSLDINLAGEDGNMEISGSFVAVTP